MGWGAFEANLKKWCNFTFLGLPRDNEFWKILEFLNVSAIIIYTLNKKTYTIFFNIDAVALWRLPPLQAYMTAFYDKRMANCLVMIEVSITNIDVAHVGGTEEEKK